jgi:acyltransferase-like protein
LASTYFQGRPPKSVNFHWRRFRLDTIPLDNQEKFDVWLRERWAEKDALMEAYLSTGRFPSSPFATEKGHDTYIETEVKTRYPFEFLQIFSVVAILAFLVNTVKNTWRAVIRGRS